MHQQLPLTTERRDLDLHIRLSDSEDEDLRKRASRQGISLASYVRVVLFPTAGQEPSYGERMHERHTRRAENMATSAAIRRDEQYLARLEERKRATSK